MGGKSTGDFFISIIVFLCQLFILQKVEIVECMVEIRISAFI